MPMPLTRFVGREHELADLERLLPATRLLTLTGAGGSGKTRLARETAQRTSHLFHRVAWIDLTPLTDPAEIASRIATAMRIPERAGTAPLEALVDAIGNSRTLLVIDNCEHLVDGCADLAEALLRACSSLYVLATSREALGVPSETAWLVPALERNEAVQLFVDRATSSAPSFALTDANLPAIAEICQRLDGIPLAIELAAARVRVLAPEQIARRLDDVFRLLSSGSRTALPRHRTLRATMEWSHDLLGPREQALLRRLSVFAGSFTLDAAEVVCGGDPLDVDDILDGISALVDKSLLVMSAGDGDARYRLLETVRQYGRERLADAGECLTYETRHAEFFLSMVEGPGLHVHEGAMSAAAIAALAAEDDNLRAAMAWAIADASRAPVALRLADGLFWYWYGTAMAFPGGQYREGRKFVEQALAIGGNEPVILRARALGTLGLIGLATGDWAIGNSALTAMLEMAVAIGDDAMQTFALAKLGATRFMEGRMDEANTLVLQAAERLVLHPPSVLHSFVWFWGGWVAIAVGDIARARAIAREQIMLGRQLRHHSVAGHSNTLMGMVELADGNLDDAFTYYSTALQYHLVPEDAWALLLDIEGFAALAAARKRYADAARLLGGSDALRERTTVAVPPMAWKQRDLLLARLREKLGANAVADLRREGHDMPFADVLRLTSDDTANHTSEFQVITSPEIMAIVAPAPAAPAVLRVQALGPLHVKVGDRVIDASAWGSARPRELLVYLLMHPMGRTKEQVGVAFWPEASSAQLRNNFHVTLHRLRKALGGADWITLTGERYRVDPALVASFDAIYFEQAVTDARRALKRKQDSAIQALEQALDSYHGDFMDGEPAGDWHLEHRDRLQLLYVEGLMALGDALMAEDRCRRAAEAFRRVLARDELHEAALQALLRCHVVLGERAQGAKVYRTFADKLQRELESEPEPETVALFEQLSRGSAVP